MLVIVETSDNTEAWYDLSLPWLSKTVKATTLQKAPENFYCSKAAFDLWATRARCFSNRVLKVRKAKKIKNNAATIKINKLFAFFYKSGLHQPQRMV